MSPKDLLFEFLNLIFIVILIVFCIFYFIAGDRFEVFTMFMKAMMPLAFFGIIFLIKLKITRTAIKERKKENNTELVLYLNVYHKLASDVVIFCTPMALGLLIFMFRGTLDAIDIIVLSILLIVLFFWQKYLFSKEEE